MKVIFLNNYDIGSIYELWLKHPSPNQHLWGIPQLKDAGLQVDILPYEKLKLLKKISRVLKIFGDLDQQIRILSLISQYDLIYSGHHFTTLFLGFLRNLGLLKKPLIAIVYQSSEPNFKSRLLTKLCIQGHDQLLCLNKAIKDHYRDQFGVPEEKLVVLPWGYDLPYYSNENEEGTVSYVVSAGKSFRDYETLINAFKQLDYPLKIYSGTLEIASKNLEIPSNVWLSGKNFIPWEDIILAYHNALAVAIPLATHHFKTYNAVGLTSLLEAMAMGKAVVITRNEFTGIDVEQERIGLYSEPGNCESWLKAINYLLSHSQEAKEMGIRGRILAEKIYNIERFSKDLLEIIKKMTVASN